IVGTKDGFAVLFQEIYQNISFPSQYNFEDWIIFRPELIKPIRKPELYLKGNSELFSFFVQNKNNKRLVYTNVIVYGKNDLLPKPLVKRRPVEDALETKEEGDWKTVPKKLEILNDLRKKNLITEKEYQRKKEELLKEF
ncbi:SHOCT domain-containing protein, partial [Leptospira sp. 96542]|nr:SHOCT domain-containing protein [Leptospira sp. 96542]